MITRLLAPNLPTCLNDVDWAETVSHLHLLFFPWPFLSLIPLPPACRLSLLSANRAVYTTTENCCASLWMATGSTCSLWPTAMEYKRGENLVWPSCFLTLTLRGHTGSSAKRCKRVTLEIKTSVFSFTQWPPASCQQKHSTRRTVHVCVRRCSSSAVECTLGRRPPPLFLTVSLTLFWEKTTLGPIHLEIYLSLNSFRCSTQTGSYVDTTGN